MLIHDLIFSKPHLHPLFIQISMFTTPNIFNRVVLVFFVILKIGLNSLFGQNPADTLIADQHYETSELLLSEGKYDRSRYYLKKASVTYKEYKLWKKYFRCSHSLAVNYTYSNKYDSAIEKEKETVKESVEIFGKNSLDEARSYNNLAGFYDDTGDLNKAIEYHQKSGEVVSVLFGEDSPHVAVVINNIGSIYEVQGLFDDAIELHEKALEIRKRKLPENHAHIASSYYNLGRVYTRIGLYDLGLEYCEKALKIQRSFYGPRHLRTVLTYGFVSEIHAERGAYNLAKEFQELSLEILKELYGEENYRVAGGYNDLGFILLLMHNYDEAGRLFEKAVNIERALFGEDSYRLRDYLLNRGHSYKGKQNYSAAIKYYNESLRLLKKTGEDIHPLAGDIYSSLGDCYEALDSSNLAIEFYNKSLKVDREVYGLSHPDIAESYHKIGLIHFEANEINESLDFYQKALIAGTADFDDTSYEVNPGTERVLDGLVVLSVLNSKAEALEKLGESAGNVREFKSALSALQLSDSLIQEIRNTSIKHSDKLNVSNIARSVYEQSIRISLTLSKETSEDNQNLAFQFAEKSKANILKEALSTVSARSFANVDSSLVILDKRLKSNLSYYQTKINESLINKTESNPDTLNKWKEKFFNVNREYDSLQQMFTQKYPDYYNLKYQNQVLSVSEVQSSLQENEAIVEYFFGDNTLYTFLITRTNFEVHQVEVDQALNTELDYLINFAKNGSFDSIQIESYNTYNQSAYSLYQKLLSPIESYPGIDKAIILPDGRLGYIPFEILQTRYEESGIIDFRKLNYLINKLELSYGYSATLITGKKENKKELQNNFLSFAPDYRYLPSDSSQSMAFGKFRDAVIPLEWNQKEANQISTYFNGKVYNGSKATESRFKEEVNKFNIIHLATHAFVDDDNPMNSKFIFSQEKDTVEDGALHAFELYNMNLNAELAVLSACQTGYGQLAKGEGVMSLARAFSYAGVPSIAMSYWQVDDLSTSQLMDLFFQNLSDGMRKSEALRRAKLDFLKTTNVRKTHPFFWSGFVIIGDDSQLESSVNYQRYYWYAFGLLLIIVICIYFLRKRQTNIN